jgi:hypothetical protein
MTTIHKNNRETSMNSFARIILPACFAVAAISATASTSAQAQSADTGFFLTSNGIGNGGNQGGLAGADNHCQTLAQAAGAGGKTWRAYLSTQAADGQPAVNARDRIGKGPWKNAKGAVVAKDVSQREGRGHQRPRRYTQPSRRADGIATGRIGVCGGRGSHLQELDEFDAGLGDGRPFRPHRFARR